MNAVFTLLRSMFAPRRSPRVPMPRDEALAVIRRAGMRAYYYLPAALIDDHELSNALRDLADRGYVFVDEKGDLVGAFAQAGLSSNERALEVRKLFRLVPKSDAQSEPSQSDDVA